MPMKKFERPQKLALLTESQLSELRDKDFEDDEMEDSISNSWVPVTRRQRKWSKSIRDAKPCWELLYKITDRQLYEVIHWLSVKDEPMADGRGRPGKIKELSRCIKYAMTPKQREVAYRIVEKRFNTLTGCD